MARIHPLCIGLTLSIFSKLLGSFFYRKAPHPMILEVITAVSIYSGALAYLASDSPVQAMALVSQPKVEMKATLASSDLSARAGLRSFTTDASGHIRYTDQPQTKHESIWAKEDGKFENWVK